MLCFLTSCNDNEVLITCLKTKKTTTLTSASVRSSVLCSVENFRVSDFFPLPLRKVRLNSVPCPFPTGEILQMSP